MSIKDRFIENVLRDEGNRLLRNQGKALRKRLKFHTHRLYDTRRISVSESRLTFTHTVYERFLDMKRLQDGTIQRRRRRIHNRLVYGHYRSIAGRLLYEFTEETIQEIRESIKQENHGRKNQ